MFHSVNILTSDQKSKKIELVKLTSGKILRRFYTYTMQREISAPCPLLDEAGHITTEGWARFPYWEYRRKDIKASPFRIKEWDYYMIFSHKGRFGISFTLSDLGFLGLGALCFFDFERSYYHQVDAMTVLPLGSLGLPAAAEVAGVINFKNKKLSISYKVSPGHRSINFACPELRDAEGNQGISGTIVLEQPEDLERTVIATSWKENRRAFYYNQKINCMQASGAFTIGAKTYQFDPATDMGSLDWGRGVWTYSNTWYWASLSTVHQGKRLGLNLGYGFSDRSPASENTILYDGRIHKLEDVTFHFNPDKHLEPWHFTSSDKRLELTMNPILDRQSNFDFKIIKSIQHQVFGTVSGWVVLDSGQRLELNQVLGMTEQVLNQW